MSKLILTGEH